jgi:hypothetical protein
MLATGMMRLTIAIPNFSLAALTSARITPSRPIDPTTAWVASATSVVASIQPRRPTRAMPETAAAMITASIERRPCSDQ